MNIRPPFNCKQARLRIICLVVLLGAPMLAWGQGQQPYARFSIEPSDPGYPYGLGIEGDRFRFSADVSQARCFRVDFGDGTETVRAAGENGSAAFAHVYTTAGNYTTRMEAWRDRDCDADLDRAPQPVRLELAVRIRPQPSATSVTPSSVVFSVAPSNRRDLSQLSGGDLEVSFADFTFTAFVSRAESYQLEFGDGEFTPRIPPAARGEALRYHHRYDEPGPYRAVMRAWRNADDLIESELLVTVTRPLPAPPAKPAARPVQWPAVTRTAPPPAQSDEADIFPLLLLFTAIAALWTMHPAATITDLVSFEPTKDRGRFRVEGNPNADYAMKVRYRNAARFKIPDNASVTDVRRRPGTMRDNS